MLLVEEAVALAVSPVSVSGGSRLEEGGAVMGRVASSLTGGGGRLKA